MTPKEIVELYNYELWNKKNYELGRKIIADNVIRHEIGSVTTLTREESIQRVVDAWELLPSIHFTLFHIIAEGDLVTIVYQMDAKDKEGQDVFVSSIEVFRVADQQICEVWNAEHTYDKWH